MIAWVTGASSGLGAYIAQALVQAGHTVVGGARSFTEGKKDGMHTYPLDVTSDESAKAFVDHAKNVAGPADALIQAAGILMLGSCEETSTEEYRRVMETDFLGMVRMNNLVLPMMRAQGAGRIVMLSSINGLLGVPYQSAYTAAKHAIEGYAECLMMETKPFGIQVMLVEPGDHRGGGQKCRLHAGAMSDASVYAHDYKSATSVIAHDEANGSDPAVLGKKVVRLLEKKHMPFRRCIASPDQHLAVLIHRICKPKFNASILRSYYIKK